MIKKITILSFVLSLLLVSLLVAQPEPVPMVTPVLIDSAVYNGIYVGGQSQIYCEPTTGYLSSVWYRYYSGGADPRRITAATSTDGGATWQIHEAINFGVGAEMNARYASACGTPTTPIFVYGDRNPGGDNRDTRPVIATDIAGWGGGAFINYWIDDIGTVDTVLYARYVVCAVSPDDNNIIAAGGYHNAAPGEAQYVYFSQDGGMTWGRPTIPFSAVNADSGASNWVFDLSSTGIALNFGANNSIMATAVAQWYHDDDLWRIIYSTSDDLGANWSPAAIIPGTESLDFSNSDFYRQFSKPIQDNAGNWHIFAVGRDTSEYDYPNFPDYYRSYDFKFDGSTWSINKFAFPQLLEDGIVAWGDWPADLERYPMNDPAIGPDGSLYYAYSDVVDTTGAMGDEANFNYNMMIMYSGDNGDSWHGPVSVLDQWTGHSPNGMAHFATDKLHIAYRRHFDTDQADMFYYIGVPTDSIKANATAVGETITKILPEDFQLHQNYPNPFNPTTNITFDLKESAKVTLKIYNEIGQEVATLINEKMDAGFRGITWNASNLPSGVYFYKLTAGTYTESKKMILTK